MGRPAIDLTGQRFGKLIVLRRDFSKSGANQRARWFVRCKGCCKEYSVSSGALDRGQRSCGCDNPRAIRHGHASHDGTMSGTYKSWSSMIQRCTNPRHGSWKGYGAKGVKVCKRWRRFEMFLADMGARPSGTQLDRFPDGRGDYKPGNVRWATILEQARNKKTVKLTVQRAEQILGRIVAGEARKDVAAEFGFSRKHVDALWRGDIWPDINRPWLKEERPRLQISKRQLHVLAMLDTDRWQLPRELGAGRASYHGVTLKQLAARGLVECRARHGTYGKTGDEYRVTQAGTSLLDSRGIDGVAIKVGILVNKLRSSDWFAGPFALHVVEILHNELLKRPIAGPESSQ